MSVKVLSPPGHLAKGLIKFCSNSLKSKDGGTELKYTKLWYTWVVQQNNDLKHTSNLWMTQKNK